MTAPTHILARMDRFAIHSTLEGPMVVECDSLERALYLNAWVPDADRKAKQRLGLYLEAGDWPRAVALEDRLDRLGLLDDDALRYAMAYGWFQLGVVDKAEDWLEGISDPRWFKDATTLREAMAECQADGWGCP